MLLNAKKTERVMLRVSEEMAQQIRALAEIEHRTVQDQVRFILTIGLSHAWPGSGNGTQNRKRQHVSAQQVLPTFAEEIPKPQPFKAGSGRQQRKSNIA